MYLVFIILVPLVFEAQAERPGYVTVLLYHRFDESRYPSTNISSDMFREQLEFIKREGYRVLSMHEFRQLLAKGKPLYAKIGIDHHRRSIPLDLRARLPLAQRICLSLYTFYQYQSAL